MSIPSGPATGAPARRRGAIGAVLLVVLLLATALVLVPPGGTALTARAPIRIVGDADFAAQATSNGWPGSGTATDPYIIEGYTISPGSGIGIDIENTRVHFIVRGNTINGNGATLFGIYLAGVHNGIVEDNTVRRAWFAHYLYVSESNTFRGNDAIDCTYAYSLVTSRGNTLVDNTGANSRFGFYLRESLRNTVVGNTVTGSKDWGVYMQAGSENQVRDNVLTAVSPSEAVIHLKNTAQNTIAGNTLSGAPRGIWVTENGNNLLDGNTITGGARGIHMDAVGGARIESNRIRLTTTGIDLQSSHGNTLVNNILENNTVGLNLLAANDNTVTGGAFRNSTTGAVAFNALRNKFIDIDATKNGIGIHLRSSRQTTIQWLEARENTQAVRMESPLSNLLEGSIFEANKFAITLSTGRLTEIRHNLILDNEIGLRLLTSDQNKIWNNRFENDQNVQVTGTSTQTWNVPKTVGVNIVGGPHLGGNHWHDYNGADADGDGLGEVPHGLFAYNRAGSELAAGLLDVAYGPDDALPLLLGPVQQDRITL